jgi:hypothetical protein
VAASLIALMLHNARGIAPVHDLKTDACTATNAVQGRNDLLDQTVSLFTASGTP